MRYQMGQPLPADAGLYRGGDDRPHVDDYEPDYWPGEDPDEATEALMENPPPPDAWVDDDEWLEWAGTRGAA